MRPEDHAGGTFQQAVETVGSQRRGQARKSRRAQRSQAETLTFVVPDVQ